MSADQLNSLNTWVAVIAITSLVQVAALAAIALVGYRLIGEGLGRSLTWNSGVSSPWPAGSMRHWMA